LSGRLESFSGPSGIGIKLRDASQKEVDAVDPRLIEPSLVEKGDLPSLRKWLDTEVVSPCDVIVVPLLLHRRYSPGTLRSYTQALLLRSCTVFLVVQDGDGVVKGYYPATSFTTGGSSFRSQLRARMIDAAGLERLIGIIAEGQADRLSAVEGFLEPCRLPLKLADSLATMGHAGIDALLVVGHSGTMKGVVRRDQLVTEFVLAMTLGKAAR